MEENENIKAPRNFSLDNFKRAIDNMITTNSNTYRMRSKYSREFVEPLREYSLEEIEEIIHGGDLEQQQTLSRTYYYADGIYKRLILYYSTLLKYCGLLIPNPSFGKDLSSPYIKKRYYSAVDYIENMNIPILCSKIAAEVLISGAYYGIIQKTEKDKFYMIDLPSKYCRSRYKTIYGEDIVEFDLQYFNEFIIKEDKDKVLKSFPKEISKAYKRWSNGLLDNSWYLIPAGTGICFKLFDTRPLFLPVIASIEKYSNSVDLEIERNVDEIRKILVQHIPHLNDGTLLFEPDEMAEMHNGSVQMLKSNPNISVLTTYADADAIQTKTTNDASANTLSKIKEVVYSTAGTSSELFSSSNSTTLETSINNDVSIMMNLANKISLFITNQVNRLYSNSNINFTYKIFPITIYNEHKYIEDSFKLVSSGYSLLMPALAQGFSQKDLINIKNLENNVLELNDILIPLSTAYTQSGENGRPTKEVSEKTEKTLEKEKSLDNAGGSNL